MSTAEQKNKRRQEYLRTLEKYEKETRAHELLNGKLIFSAVKADDETVHQSWYSYYIVTQNMLHTHEGK